MIKKSKRDNVILNPSFVRVDKRGVLKELINNPNKKWSVLNYGTMKKGAIIGNHYHKKTEVFFFLTKGKAKVIIEEARLTGLGPLKCNSIESKPNELIMINGKGRLTCKTIQEISNLDHYPVDLYIKMNYGYVDSINTGFTLKKDIFF